MKRLVVSTIVLTALAVGAQAGGFPEAPRLVNRIKVLHQSHFLRDPQVGKRGGGSSQSGTAEARQAAPAPTLAQQQKPEPKPAKAD